LATLLTTLILLARLLFVGVHICSSNFLPGMTTSALKRSSSKPFTYEGGNLVIRHRSMMS
jgi:hypothetical protein